MSALLALLALLALMGLFLAPPVVRREPPARSDPEPTSVQPSFLSRAVFVEGRLWLLSDHGELSSLGQGETSRSRESLAGRALDLCSWNGRPAVVTCEAKPCSRWTLRRKTGDRWAVETSVARRGDELVALACETGQPMLVTNRRLIELGGPKPRVVKLRRALDRGLVASVQVRKREVLVGLDAGEWGGGLRRIDRASGQIEAIERNATGDLCGGPLNTQCDPVHGIATEPWNPECVVVAVGLEHFVAQGRLVEVCGKKVRSLYSAPYWESPSGGPEDGKEAPPAEAVEPLSTVAFFGLARVGDEIWAASFEGVYRIRKGEVVRTGPLPAFRQVDGVYVSFENPSLVFVLTQINRRASVSGSVPMIVGRR